MDFETTRPQKMIVDAVAQFVRDVSTVERFRQTRDTEQGWDPQVWKQMADYGWLAIAFPEDVGGIDGDFIDMALILEQLGRGLVPEPYIPSVVLAGSLLGRLGTPGQIETVLQPMMDGDTSLALAYAERQSRYQLADCKTSAQHAGDGWTLNGEKVWVLNGHAADQILVVARTSGGQLDSAGLSLFIVPADAAGLTRTPVKTMDGQRAAFLSIDGVQVGAEALLGEEGAAFGPLEWAMDRAAAAACAEGQGHLHELFERTVEYLKQREQFGSKIGSFQALQHRAAEMLAETELCKGMMLLAALKVDSEDAEERRSEVSAAKAHLTSGGWFVQENAVQLHGGIGVTDEQDIGLYFKRLRVLQGLFGDADFHVDRFQAQSRFDTEEVAQQPVLESARA